MYKWIRYLLPYSKLSQSWVLESCNHLLLLTHLQVIWSILLIWDKSGWCQLGCSGGCGHLAGGLRGSGWCGLTHMSVSWQDIGMDWGQVGHMSLIFQEAGLDFLHGRGNVLGKRTNGAPFYCCCIPLANTGHESGNRSTTWWDTQQSCIAKGTNKGHENLWPFLQSSTT